LDENNNSDWREKKNVEARARVPVSSTCMLMRASTRPAP
jgi:hypothetical protein